MITIDLYAGLAFIAIVACLAMPLILYATRSPDPVDESIMCFYIGLTVIVLTIVSLLGKWMLGDDGAAIVVIAWMWLCVNAWQDGTEELEGRYVVQVKHGQR